MAKPKKKKNKGGRPTKYKEKYCEEIVEFFSVPPYEDKVTESYNKMGREIKTYHRGANDIPFLSGFARKIGVCHDTILEWAEKHEGFSVALKKAKELQEEFLITNGLLGLYNSTFAIFTAKNITDMRDQQNIQVDALIEGAVGVAYLPNLLPVKVGLDYSYLLGDDAKKALPEGKKATKH